MPDGNRQAIEDRAFQALLEEYQAVRAACLFREEVKTGLENVIVVLLSAAVAVLPIVLHHKQYHLLLVVSALSSILSLSRLAQVRLLTELSRYEHDKLRAELEKTVGLGTELWSWQSEFSGLLWNRKGPSLFCISLNVIEVPLLLIPTGSIVVFGLCRGIRAITPYEYVMLFVAVVLTALLWAGYVSATRASIGVFSAARGAGRQS